jgi:glycosyltransferase involved in cell wall biosynthesis
LRSVVYAQVLARGFDRVLAVSRDLALRLVREEGVRSSRLVTLVNGVEVVPPSAPTPEERARARAALGIPAGVPTLVTLGRFGRRKGHEVLLRAAAAVPARPWELLLLGDGDLEQECRALAGTLGLGTRARFLGFQDDTLPYLLAADVVVIPSYSEGIPRALLEGMVAGLAPVASDIGGVREVLEAPRYGLTFPAGDVGALAACLDELWSTPRRRQELGRRARERVVADYGAERLVDQHRRLYHELLVTPS